MSGTITQEPREFSHAGPTIETREGVQFLVFSNAEGVKVERTVPIPYRMIERYAKAAARLAEIEPDDGKLVATISGFDGVWASGATEADVVMELIDVIEEWATLKLIDGDDDIPVVDGIDLVNFS